MAYAVPLDRLSKSDIPTAGGKGANLGELSAAGLPVPPGFVLTTSAYDLFVEEHSLQDRIVDIARAVRPGDPQQSEVAASEIRKLFVASEMPGEIADDLLAANDALGEIPVAVRSSATAEDLPTASFAGQQDTYLNVLGDDALVDATRRCWASLWTARAITYRLREGIDPETVSLAVVVQEMVPADAAGILFTANPLNGVRNELVINATWGLGEAIVSGQVTPDVLVIDKPTFFVESREIALKTTMTVRTEAGTEEQPVPAGLQDVAVLTDDSVDALARIGVDIETHYGTPMDVEWAVVEDEVYVTQARPITAMPPEPLEVTWEAPTPDSIWMRRQIVEHMPEPLSPLFADLYVEQGLSRTAQGLLAMMTRVGDIEMDFDEFMPHGFATTINGFGYSTGTYKVKPRMMKVYLRLGQLLKQPDLDWEGTVLPGYQATIAHWASIDRGVATEAELLEGIRELSAADSGYWFGSMVRLILSRVVDTLFDRLLQSFVIRPFLPGEGLRSSEFVRGFESRAIDAQTDMEALAAAIAESDELRELVLATPAEDLLSAFAWTPAAQQVFEGIERYLSDYGHQIYNLDYIAPTQSENPLPMLLSLQALVKSPPEPSARERQAAMARDRDALVDETAEALNPVSRWAFRRAWTTVSKYAPFRELILFYIGAAWPTVRSLAAELGRRLVDAGVLATVDDVYYLDSSEIAAVIEQGPGTNVVSDFRALVAERRDLRNARMQLTPPPKVPERSAIKLGPFELHALEPTPEEVVVDGAALQGFAVSAGRVTAPASVVYDIENVDEMQPGSILVCATTTPAWTPLFSQAAGLVTDVGGALAHGSIVAREYGIPAVMGTGVATELIKSGMLLEVDGNVGTVRLVDETGSSDASEPSASGKHRRKWIGLAAVVLAAVGLTIWRRSR